MTVTLFGFVLKINRIGTASAHQKSSSTPNVAASGLTQGTQATPMTDAAVRQILQTGHHEKVKAEFARQLERKLNEYHRNNG